MAYHRDLAEEAKASYRGGRTRDAILLYRRAARMAMDSGDRAAWFEYTVWAAESARLAEDFRMAFALLLDARAEEPAEAPSFERAMTRSLQFFLTMKVRPVRSLLEERLRDIRMCGNDISMSSADVAYLEGVFFESVGDWSRALAAVERAWAAHVGSPGIIQSAFGYVAARCCLRLGLWPAVRDWIKAIGKTECRERYESVRVHRAELALRLSLAQGLDAAEPKRRLQGFQDRAYGLQNQDITNELRELNVRTHLLLPREDDPCERSHASRQELYRRRQYGQNVHARYSARLLLLDYRLACVRYAANMPPAEDFYYAQPQQVPVAIPRTAELAFRLRKADAARRWAEQSARYLDGLLECDWRTQEVHARKERLREIENHVT